MAKRIQRRRDKGWKLPDNAVIVDRTSRYGNPFKVSTCLDEDYADNELDARRICVIAFVDWIDGGDTYWMGPESDRRRQRLMESLHLLRGKDLACTCPLPEPGQVDHCHGVSLMKRANR